MIQNLSWVLPRPSNSKYKGSFPLNFEKMLLKRLGINYKQSTITLKKLILHPFGGKSEFGFRVDIRPEVNPDLIGDAHELPEDWTNKFQIVILDPPYSNEENEEIYGNTGKLKWGTYTKEAIRVTKPGGFIVIYHKFATPGLKDCKLIYRIFLETRIWHLLRSVRIYQKKGKLENSLLYEFFR